MEASTLSPSASQIEDFRFASSKMQGAKRRSFLAEIALKYCNGSARKTESLFGWGRDGVNTGLGENVQVLFVLEPSRIEVGIRGGKNGIHK